MIRLNVDEQTLETGLGLDRIIKDIIWYQVIYPSPFGGDDIELKSTQKLMYDRKDTRFAKQKELNKKELPFNLLKPLCDTATSTFLGRVPDIVTNGTDRERERISKFSLALKHNDFEEEIYDVALQCSITGSGFLCLYNDSGDTFPKYRSLDPLYTNVVYDCSVAMKRLFAFTIYYEADNNGDGTNGKYICIVYTKDKMFAYNTGSISVETKQAFRVYPCDLFLINGIEKSWVSYHGYKDIPIIEFFNNKECISDCKPVLPQILLYTALQNNRFSNVGDIMNYLLFIKNARLGNEEEAKEALDLIKNHRVLPLEGDNVDAKFLSNPLNQTDIQKLADDFKNNIHYISSIPDFTSVEFTQNASDPVLKAKTKPLLDLCLSKEKWFNKGYMLVLDLTLDFAKQNDTKLYNELGFKLDNIDLVYTHTLPSNDTDMVNNIVNLNNQGLLAPRIALQGLSFIPNVDEYLKEVKEFNIYIDERKAKSESKNNGLNETNLERQNEKPVGREQQDNLKNFTKGKSQDLSDNKV